MEELVAALVAALAALLKRTGNPRRQAIRLPRESGAAGKPAPARAVPGDSRAVEHPIPVQRPAVSPSHDASLAGRAVEVNLVRGLFAGPQSLAAAFIAAEILAKPVALREH